MTHEVEKKAVEVRCVYLVNGLCSCPEAIRILGRANHTNVSCILRSGDPRIQQCSMQWDRL